MYVHQYSCPNYISNALQQNVLDILEKSFGIMLNRIRRVLPVLATEPMLFEVHRLALHCKGQSPRFAFLF